MSNPKLNQPLLDALEWAKSEGGNHELARRLEKIGKWGSAGDNAMEIMAVAYLELEKKLEAARAYKKIMKTENDNLRKQIAKLTK
jgi:hypothetical protein